MLKRLAILAGEDGKAYTLDDVLSHIDFWMSDRASDADALLEKLGIDVDKRLKCCGHICLTVDEAMEYVFKQVRNINTKKLLFHLKSLPNSLERLTNHTM